MDSKNCGGNVHGMGSGTEYIYIYISMTKTCMGLTTAVTPPQSKWSTNKGFNHSSHTAAVSASNLFSLMQAHHRIVASAPPSWHRIVVPQ